MKLNLKILNLILEAMNFNIDDEVNVTLSKLTNLQKSSEIFGRTFVEQNLESLNDIILSIRETLKGTTGIKAKYKVKFLEILITDLNEFISVCKYENIQNNDRLIIELLLKNIDTFLSRYEIAHDKLPRIEINKDTLNSVQRKVHDRKELRDIINKLYNDGLYDSNLNYLDVSSVTDMACLFRNLKKCNYDISRWDVSNVKNMEYMFEGCEKFNCDISSWNTSKVKNMSSMFSNAKSFNLPLEKWNTSKVENMSCMFSNANSFNLPLEKWDISNVRKMSYMFYNAKSFNLPIGNWPVKSSKVNYILNMFVGAKSFNLDISNWKIKKDYFTSSMFDKCPINKKYKPDTLIE